jgi:cysteine synthase
MQIKGTIFMPTTTPNQKVKQVKMFGKEMIDVRLVGDTFDDAYAASIEFCDEKGATFVHPFDDLQVIEGQGTVGLEIFKDADVKIDYLLLAVGGGGLASGVSCVFRQLSPHTRIIGVEPLGAPAMESAFEKDEIVTLEKVDKFVDGAAVKRVGDLTFEICRQNLEKVLLVPEGKVCSTILQLYNEEAIVAEPAGALTIAALDFMREEIKGKNVVCLVSGGNNDITKTHVAWKTTRSLPYVSSPLYHRGRLYTVKNGGLFSCYDAKTGKVFYQDERLGAAGDYYSSAVAAGEKILLASQKGIVLVIRAGDVLEVLARNDLGEQIFATPAIVDGTLYVRTASALHAFRSR